ncbi:TIM-barrel domain-containing protein [Acidipila sp. EB88]|uniref:glycoside hydrolase family 31 protein n=1 Tax=Acidipila sp. EB88 TaxID=2305226 RepID=UPI000F5EF30D|nr:TIM-barrel domain-containing protein [Acidipila sp. EB88]RRA47502.1 glycoside hydrolase family 31 protein [Acidipila sp. EB88]
MVLKPTLSASRAGLTGHLRQILTGAAALLMLPVAPHAHAQMQQSANGVQVHAGSDTAIIELAGRNLVHVHVLPGGQESPRALVLDPNPTVPDLKSIGGSIQLADATHAVLDAPAVRVRVDTSHGAAIDFCDPENHCLRLDDVFSAATRDELPLELDHAQSLYGMRGLELLDSGRDLTRNQGAIVAAGVQGDGGAPFFFTNHLGVLVDASSGTFKATGPSVRFSGSGRKDLEFYVAFGPPMTVVSAMVKLSGLPPMPPKWTLGFINSQWGTDEADLKKIVAEYRQKQIPLDGFILDFDWKAWGEDNYGEWRWNSTTGAGAAGPDKFPDGASGAFALDLAKQGVKLSGILKPRILLSPEGAPTARTEAAAYADAHNLWFPDEAQQDDYFTKRMARNLNFDLAETRRWFWEHLKPAFQAGMAGWWNDEADSSSVSSASNLQFLNMARMLYDGQRSVADQRVWSLNRTYFLGSNRYGYAVWSGDIDSGFPSMAYQRRRMLAAMDLGASHWSMDTGGFHGHPTPENYARWMEFAAWVPIDRVHGDFGEKRQPWMYGPVAEAAATQAIKTRYALLPYLYSYEHGDHLTGIGVVRPMFWMFPDDEEASRLDSQWMFGDAFLVSPVVTPGVTKQRVYLPAGMWHDFSSGQQIEGNRWYDAPVNAQTWGDTPVFVRDGSIIASQEPQQYAGERPVDEVTLDVFPAARNAEFTYYDDDGVSYRYEAGGYFEQGISVQQNKFGTQLHFATASGTLKPALTHYVVRVHQHARKVTLDGRTLATAPAATTQGDNTWRAGTDKYGDVTVFRVPAGTKLDVTIH